MRRGMRGAHGTPDRPDAPDGQESEGASPGLQCPPWCPTLEPEHPATFSVPLGYFRGFLTVNSSPACD